MREICVNARIFRIGNLSESFNTPLINNEWVLISEVNCLNRLIDSKRQTPNSKLVKLNRPTFTFL